MSHIPGIHHVTAISTDAQRTVDFYAGPLGLRLVKLTVNFDNPGTYHLYFGDEIGTPGTILTFFPWPGSRKGISGAGQVTAIAFAAPGGSIGYWAGRLKKAGVTVELEDKRFGEEVLGFRDPDGLLLEIMETEPGAAGNVRPSPRAPVPEEHAIRGFHSVTITERSLDETGALLLAMGFNRTDSEGARFRFETGSVSPGAILDVLVPASAASGLVSAGTVHHIAWRVPDDEEQLRWRGLLSARGLNVTPVIDRNYFHSIYFHEPGGVLFELATDPPGFAIDEPVSELGSKLKLPQSLEQHRRQIEGSLPLLRLPGSGEAIHEHRSAS